VTPFSLGFSWFSLSISGLKRFSASESIIADTMNHEHDIDSQGRNAIPLCEPSFDVR
jgi:hypothetical protein